MLLATASIASIVIIIAGLRIASLPAPAPNDKVRAWVPVLLTAELGTWAFGAFASAYLGVRTADYAAARGLSGFHTIGPVMLGTAYAAAVLVATMTVGTWLALNRLARGTQAAGRSLRKRLRAGESPTTTPMRLAEDEYRRQGSAAVRQRAVRARGLLGVVLIALTANAMGAAYAPRGAYHGPLLWIWSATWVALAGAPVAHAYRLRLWFGTRRTRQGFAGQGIRMQKPLDAYVPVTVRVAATAAAATAFATVNLVPHDHRVPATGIIFVMLSGLVAFEDLTSIAPIRRLERRWEAGRDRATRQAARDRIIDALHTSALRLAEFCVCVMVLGLAAQWTVDGALRDSLTTAGTFAVLLAFAAAAAQWLGDQLPAVVSELPEPDKRPEVWRTSEPRLALLTFALVLFLAGNSLLLISELL